MQHESRINQAESIVLPLPLIADIYGRSEEGKGPLVPEHTRIIGGSHVFLQQAQRKVSDNFSMCIACTPLFGPTIRDFNKLEHWYSYCLALLTVGSMDLNRQLGEEHL